MRRNELGIGFNDNITNLVYIVVPIMLDRIRAWSNILQIGINTKSMLSEINHFYKTNVLKVLDDIGFFEFLKLPQNFQSIVDHFNVIDKQLLSVLIQILVSDHILTNSNSNSDEYSSNVDSIDKYLSNYLDTKPRAFDDYMITQWCNIIKYLPNALRGDPIEFTKGLNMFHWDSTLKNRVYTKVSDALISFVPELCRSKKILEIYSTNGFSTAKLFLKKIQYTTNNSYFEIIGVDTDNDFCNIASDEFENIVRSELQKRSIKDIDNFILKNNHSFPTFNHIKSYYNLDFDDNSFDLVLLPNFSLQIWNYHKMLAEAIRVSKRNGIISGVVTLRKYPISSSKFDTLNYTHLHFRCIKGSTSHPLKSEFIRYIQDLGGHDLKIITPVSLFKFTKV